MNRRRTITLNERLQPCDCCAYPLSCRHHVLDFAEYGENDITCNFCPNCHSLYHIAWNALVGKHVRAIQVWQGFLKSTNGVHPAIQYMINKVQEAFQIKLEYDLEHTTKSRADSAFKVNI